MEEGEFVLKLMTVAFVGCIVWLNCRMLWKHKQFKKFMRIDENLMQDFLTALEDGDKEECKEIKALMQENLSKMRKAI